VVKLTELSMCGSDAASCQIALTTCYYWVTICKTVRSVLSDRCPTCLSVCLSGCDIAVLWPYGWTDKDETWHRGRLWPRSHCVRWGPSSPKGAQPLSAFQPISTVTNGWMDQYATWYGLRR